MLFTLFGGGGGGCGTTLENVLMFRYPFETDSTLLKDELSKYGEVHDIRFRECFDVSLPF